MDPLDFFPYKPRGDQKKVIYKIHRFASEGKRVLFQAPTGYGKTPVILSALLPLAIELGIPIIWAVRTGGETDRVIEELVEISSMLDVDVFGLSFRGKRDMCLLARDMGIIDHESVSELCKRVKKKCKYFLNLPENPPYFDKPLLFSQIFNFSRREGICPYYLQFRLLRDALVVSFSYNYVFSDYFYWPIKRFLTYSGAFLVIDEAHNIDKAVSNLFSVSITLTTLKRSLGEIQQFRDEKAGYVKAFLEDLHDFLISESRRIIGEDDIFDPDDLIDSCNVSLEVIDLIDKYASLVISRRLAESKPPRSSLRRLSNFLKAVIDSRNVDGIAFIKYVDNNRTVFEVWDMRISEHLFEKWEEFESIIFTSGTLRPYEAFAEVIGISDYAIVEGRFDIPRENVLPIIVKGVSTKGEELSDEMVSKYVILLQTILDRVDRNTAIFFASYRIQEYFKEFLAKTAKDLGRPIFVEREKMTGDEVRETFKRFTNAKNAVLAGVMGGKFSEGLDYPGSALEAIVLVGIPFDRVTKRTEIYINYFSSLYGAEKGRYYAYIVPALRKASQAIGRAIRSPSDRAIIIAADERYSYPTYFYLLPDFFVKNVKIVKNYSYLLKFIERFEGR